MPFNKERFLSPAFYTLRNLVWKIRPWKGIQSGFARFGIIMANMSYWSYKSYEEYTDQFIIQISKLNTPNGRKLRSM
jgi:hypothetical protein